MIQAARIFGRKSMSSRNLGRVAPVMGLGRHGYGTVVHVSWFRGRARENGEFISWYKLLKQLGERRIYLALKSFCMGNPVQARRLTDFMTVSETVRHQLKFYSETGRTSNMQIQYICLDHACRDFAKAYTPGIFASTIAFIGGLSTLGNYLYQSNQLNKKLAIIKSEVHVVIDRLEVQSEMLSDLDSRSVEEKESSEKQVRKLVASVKEDLMKEVALVQLEVQKEMAELRGKMDLVGEEGKKKWWRRFIF